MIPKLATLAVSAALAASMAAPVTAFAKDGICQGRRLHRQFGGPQRLDQCTGHD